MKTDENYIYPESAEELAMFYGCIAETQMRDEKWVKSHIAIGDLNEIKINFTPYRIPLPTINDLKVGDVVSIKGGKGEIVYINHETKLDWIIRGVAPMKAISLLIGRNTWVPVKCD